MGGDLTLIVMHGYDRESPRPYVAQPPRVCPWRLSPLVVQWVISMMVMWILCVSQAKLERVLDYTKQTMVAYMSEADLDRLCGYITEYSLGDTPREVSPVSVDPALKSIDLMHFGWNIGKAFGKSTSTPPHSLRMYLLTPSATSKSQPSNARCRTQNQSAG